MQGLRKGFFSFNIQQLVLSISLLSAGLAKMAEMIQFDFHTIIYMAWMSFIAHLAILFLLQDYFSSRVYRFVELFSTLVCLILLCLALYPTTNWAWVSSVLTKSGCVDTAHCAPLENKVLYYWQLARESNISRGLSPQNVLSYLILIFGYIWQAISLLKSEGYVHKQVLRKPLWWVERAIISHLSSNVASGPQTTFTKFRRATLLGLYCFLLALLDLLGSFAFHLFIVFVALGWGLMQLLVPRFHVLPACIREVLNQWDFGQILPMISLLIPFYGVVEQLSSKYNSRQEQANFFVSGRTEHMLNRI